MQTSFQRLRWKLLACVLVLCTSLYPKCDAQERKSNVCPRDPMKFGEIQKQAAANVAKAQATLASCYELGRNVKPSRAEVLHWLALAAKQEYAPAEHELGRIYLYGRGVPADYKQALIWEEKAAQRGERRAQ